MMSFGKMEKSTVASLLGLLALSSSSFLFVNANSDAVVTLTPSTYTELTAGKVVFIKAYAPWCGHCQEMKPHWDKLGAKYAGHAKYLLAEIDCTADDETEEFCDTALGVEGFPTMLFGDPSREGLLLEEYMGERDYETLSSFAETMFATPLCNVDHLEGCDAETRKQLETYLAMSVEQVDTELEKMIQVLDEVDEQYELDADALQEQYDELASDHQQIVDEMSKLLRMYKEVKELKNEKKAE